MYVNTIPTLLLCRLNLYWAIILTCSCMEICCSVSISQINKRLLSSGLLFALLFSVAGGLKNVELILPSAVIPGGNATLLCNYNLEGEPLYTVKWYKGRHEFYRFVPKELPHTRVFPLPGINVDISQSGADKVVLRDIQAELAGKYRCEVSTDAPDFHTEVVAANMVVIAAEERKPVIKLEKTTYSIGDVLRGNCTSPPSLPPSNISWFINSYKVNNSFVQVSESYNRMVTTAGLQLHVDALFNGRMRLRCVTNIHNVLLGDAEVSLSEDQPRLASVLGTRDSAKSESITLWRWSFDTLIIGLLFYIIFR